MADSLVCQAEALEAGFWKMIFTLTVIVAHKARSLISHCARFPIINKRSHMSHFESLSVTREIQHPQTSPRL
jgi:hypothetical protein